MYLLVIITEDTGAAEVQAEAGVLADIVPGLALNHAPILVPLHAPAHLGNHIFSILFIIYDIYVYIGACVCPYISFFHV